MQDFLDQRENEAILKSFDVKMIKMVIILSSLLTERLTLDYKYLWDPI